MSYQKNHHFNHEKIDKLQQNHPAIRMLNATNAPLILSFLYLVFIDPNRRSIAYPDLVSLLSDYLYYLRDIYGEAKYPRSAKEYIEQWCEDESGFLRKYYTHQSDEPDVDLTPEAELAIEWFASLEQKQFIGTESRLLSLFQILNDMAMNSLENPEQRIQYLQNEKEKIDQEILAIKKGHFTKFDETQLKERYYQAEDMAKRLLSDFRQVEYNFRYLDHEVREKIAKSDLYKGKLLDDIFLEQDLIRDSDQGKSFSAFWEFLMSPASQEILEKNLNAIHTMSEIQKLTPKEFLKKIKFYLMDAGEKVYQTNNLLAEQLRRFLDDRTYLDNKRIMELIKEVEKKAINIRQNIPKKRNFATLEDIKPNINLIMSRQLFTPPKNPIIEQSIIEEGQADVDIELLYKQYYVNEKELQDKIDKTLQTQSQISLFELIKIFPIEKGLAEIITYIKIANHHPHHLIYPEEIEKIMLSSSNKTYKCIELPKVIFTRSHV